MKIILAGGGTAGHINPAIAIAQGVRKRYPSAEMLFIGRAGGNENEAIKKLGYEVKELNVRGIERRLTARNIKSVILALSAEREAANIIKNFKPDAVVGTGGYVCWPVLHAAKRLKIPTLIHESNLYPGLVTKLCAKSCSEVLLNHEGTREYLNGAKNIKVIGNPLRADFGSITRAEARKKLSVADDEILIVSFGGSGGAAKMNDVLLSFIESHSMNINKVRHIHATGKKYFSKYSKIKQSAKERGCIIAPYIEDMPTVLRAADIVVCRCGAVTLSEIALVGTAAILIPSPNVTGNHQYKNGKYLEDMGAAILLSENELTVKTLTEKIVYLENNPQERQRLSRRISAFANPKSTDAAIDEIIKQIKK